MSDQYFKDKADEIFKLVEMNINFEDIYKAIYIGLKEVARDQRYACIDAVRNYPHTDAVSNLQGLIQNANIEVKNEFKTNSI